MKYPRTYHFSCSQEIFSDDKQLTSEIEESFLNKTLIMTEKMDGGNSCLDKAKVFARTHEVETFHPSFSKLKALYNEIYYTVDFNFDRYMLFGENMQAIHSIVYDKLDSPFYLFAIFDKKEKKWCSWEQIQFMNIKLKLKIVHVIATRSFKTLKELRDWVNIEMKKKSHYGDIREGIVFRDPASFKENEFSEKVAKVVRRGHIQSDDHWSKNWKEQKIIT